MVPGEMVVTCFSGLLQFQAPFPVDYDGPVVALLDVRLPPVPGGSPVPVLDTNWNALAYHNELGNPGHEWTAENLGQVFGITLDDADPPNIYVSATTLYGLFPFGPGGAGAVYRIDGVTGDICTVAQLPNTGPALGDVCYDATSRSLFVSNFEDGIVYRVPLSDNDPCALVDPVPAYDHGLDGRPNGVHPVTGTAQTALADDPSVDFTQRDRRVWAVQVHEGRLYYSVWVAGNPHEIWSVELDGAGNANPATAFYEIATPPRPSGAQNYPVSDITFSDAGNMFVAQRSIFNDFGGLHNGTGGGAHASNVLKFEGGQGAWVPSVEEYKIGAFSTSENSAGGVAVDCEENVWASGDALHLGASSGYPGSSIYGWQWIAAGGNGGDPATVNSYLIGVNGGGGFKYQIGDVELYEEECSCMEVANDDLVCDPENPGDVLYTFDVTNLSGIDAARVLLTPVTPGLTITPNTVTVPVPDGATETLTTTLSGFDPEEEVCFIVTLLSEDGYACCSQEVCLDVPPCDCFEITRGEVVCDPDNPGNYNVSFTAVNLSGDTVEHVYLFPQDSGITVTPNYFDVPTVAPGGTTPSLEFTIEGGSAGDEVCILISIHNEGLEQCCAVEKCLTLPECCEDDTTPPELELIGDMPQEVPCGVDFTPPRVLARDDCDGQVDVSVEGAIDTSVPGLQCITYTATDSSGNSASITYCVTVVGDCCEDDVEPPVLEIGLAPAEIDCNGQWPAPSVSAFDDCDGEVEVSIEGEVDTTVPGEYCITYTATDAAGNSVSETICVTVLDNCCKPDLVGPDIIFLTPFPAEVDCGGQFPYPEVVGRDDCDGEVQVKWDGFIDTNTPGEQCLTYVAEDSAGNVTMEMYCVTVLDNCEGEAAGPAGGAFHSADRNRDNSISLSELLRVIQFFSQGGYHCDATTEDGFAPGPGSHDGPRHDCDYNVKDWAIDLFELIRLVQFYNAGSYHPCEDGEDRFCPGSVG
jgi:hypothetical protein